MFNWENIPNRDMEAPAEKQKLDMKITPIVILLIK